MAGMSDYLMPKGQNPMPSSGLAPMMWDAPNAQPWYRQPGYRPTNFLMDAAAKFIGQPLADAYTGLMQAGGLQQDPNAPEGYVSHGALNTGAQGIAGGQLAGSVFGRAIPSPAISRGARVYHYGKAPIGGKFDVSKSAYDGDVFVAPTSKEAQISANYGGPYLHELNLGSGGRIFDFENPSHVQGALKWWDDNYASGSSAGARDDLVKNLKRGEFSSIEPDTSNAPGYTVNPHIRSNFDGYYMKEAPWSAHKTLGLHKKNSLYNKDGSVFYSPPATGALVPTFPDQNKTGIR